MKKIYSFLAAAILTFGFTACDDVPAPYEVDDEPGSGGGEQDASVILDESFATSLGTFTSISTEGDFPWEAAYSSAQITSYVDTDGDGTKENNPADSWLVSKALDLTSVEAAHISFEYILRYANSNELTTNYQLLISKDYVADVTAATWTTLDYNLVQGSDWDTWAESGNVDVPAEFCGVSGVHVALRYVAKSKSATWEVKNFKIEKGAGDYNKQPDVDPNETKALPYSEAFSSTLGGFVNYTTDGAGAWIIDYSTAKASGYDNSTKITTAGTYYIVSPNIDLTGATEVHASYEYILRYNRADENQQFLINANFDPANPTAGWVVLNQNHTEGTDWSTFASADLQIPAEYLGKTIRVAFRYNTDAESGSTWEVKNFSIQAGKAGEAGGGEEGGGSGEEGGGSGEGDVTNPDADASNGGFENWNGGQPVNWKSTTTATKGAITQSTDAHSGKYAAEVAGTTSGNNRLAYTELTLPAGDYTMTFYVKAATATGGSVRPGYAIVTNGAIADGSAYKYGDYTNDLTTGEWVLVTHTFTLTAETVINPVVMISKKPGANVIFDDFTLADANGKFYIK